jgi:hypothetical protein
MSTSLQMHLPVRPTFPSTRSVLWYGHMLALATAFAAQPLLQCARALLSHLRMSMYRNHVRPVRASRPAAGLTTFEI